MKKELWTCPKCKRKFANKNQFHSCGIYFIEEFLKGNSPIALSLYNSFIGELNSIGPFIYAPAKTRVGFQVRMIFAVIYKLGSNYIRGHLILAHKSESRKFNRIEVISQRNIIHYFRIVSKDFFDKEFKELLIEAYQVGE